MIIVISALSGTVDAYFCIMQTMEKREINTRDDVSHLVRTFYAKVRQNDFIGHFFNQTIQDWEHHLEKITDFWTGNLLGIPMYKGRPPMEHIKLDYAFGHTITPEHFGEWLNIWIQTLDEGFTGEKVTFAKEHARNLAHFFMMRILQARPQE